MKRTSLWKGMTTISHNGFATFAEAKKRATTIHRPLTKGTIRILADRMLAESMKPKKSSPPSQPAKEKQLVGLKALGGIA